MKSAGVLVGHELKIAPQIFGGDALKQNFAMESFTHNGFEDFGLYEVKSLPLVGPHADRKLSLDVGGAGRVNLNILSPGARAGNHYHQKVHEVFINPGPEALLLHLRSPEAAAGRVVEMLPASLSQINAYHPKLGVTHMVENPSPRMATLIIVVDQNDPDDVFPLAVY
ncbi:MAG: hypothetical protein ALAOOOJD_01357 [bacterium]|nr:hypothetical protein [bacterium]